MYWPRREDTQKRRSNCIPREADLKLFLKSICSRSQIMARSFIRAAATMRAGRLNWRALTWRTARRSALSSKPIKRRWRRARRRHRAKFFWKPERFGEERAPLRSLLWQGRAVRGWSLGGQAHDDAAERLSDGNSFCCFGARAWVSRVTRAIRQTSANAPRGIATAGGRDGHEIAWRSNKDRRMAKRRSN